MKETRLKTNDPTTLKVISINDPHLTATTPPAFKTDYLQFLENNLQQLFELGRRQKVDLVIWGGDLFHLREPRNNPAWLIARAIRLLLDSGLRHAAIAGNHDLRYGALETGLHGSPFDLLLAAGALTLLDHEELVLETGDGLTARTAGGSYHHGRAEHVRDKTKKGADRLVTAGHFWLGTQTGEFYGEPLYGHDFFANAETDVLIVGHHHEDKGVHRAHGKHFVAPGSITITGTHAHDLQRRPAASLITISRERTDVHVLRPKCPPASDLLDLERHTQLKKEKEETDEFIHTLAQTELLALDPETVLENLAPTLEVKTRVQFYLEKAEAAR